MLLLRRLLLVSTLCLVGCSTPPPVPVKPAGVPAAALWAGGADGGVFLLIDKKAQAPRLVYDVVIYDDSIGDVWFKGRMKLSAPGELDARSRRDPKVFDGWDGTRLHLADGRHLTPLTDPAAK